MILSCIPNTTDFAPAAARVVSQGFLASERKAALELFDKAEEHFKQCRDKVCCGKAPHPRH
jgi:hypothetical protein